MQHPGPQACVKKLDSSVYVPIIDREVTPFRVRGLSWHFTLDLKWHTTKPKCTTLV